VTLVVSLCDPARPLGRREFVDPIAAAVGEAVGEAVGVAVGVGAGAGAGEGVRVVGYSDVTARDVEAAGGAVLCGTALRDNGFMDRLDAFEWLRDTDAPVLGICAGMEVLGLVNGARLVPCKEIGMTRVRVVRPDPLLPADLEAYELHSFALEDLAAFDVLAESDRCVQAVRLRGRPHWGVMFHPEVRRPDVVHRFCGLGR
jgi:GMP synthase-like glutamine amidotransferase